MPSHRLADAAWWRAAICLTTRMAIGLVAVAFLGCGKTGASLTDELQSPDAGTRRAAAEKAGDRKDLTAIPPLAHLLQDANGDVREAAAKALAQMGPPAVPALAEALSFSQEPSRLAALRALKRLGPSAKDAKPQLIAALKDKSVEVRIGACGILGSLKDQARDALPALIEAARDLDNLGGGPLPGIPYSVAEAAIHAGLVIDPNSASELAQSSLPALVNALQSNQDDAIMSAAVCMQKLGRHGSPALPALEEAFGRVKGETEKAVDMAIVAAGGDDTAKQIKIAHSPKVTVHNRLLAISRLTQTKTPERSVPALVVLLIDPNVEIRIGTVEALGHIGPKAKGAIAPLLRLLEDEQLDEIKSKHWQGKYHVVGLALLAMGTEPVVHLAEVLDDQNAKPFARGQAARALSLYGRKAKSVLPILDTALKDASVLIAAEASCAYFRAGGGLDKAMPPILRALDDPSDSVKIRAIEIVTIIGSKAKLAIPRVTALLNDGNRDVRISAAVALGNMGPEAAAAAPAMARLLKTQDFMQFSFVASALTRLGPNSREALPLLLEIYDEFANEPALGTRILEVIAGIGPGAKQTVPLWMSIIRERKFNSPMEHAIAALGRIGPDAHEAVPLLTRCLVDTGEGQSLRAAAAKALGEIGPKAQEAMAALEILQDDTNPNNQIWATYALARITGDKSYVEALASVLQRELKNQETYGWQVLGEITQALELLGPQARPARDVALAAVVSDKENLSGNWRLIRMLGYLHEDADIVVPVLIVLTERRDRRLGHFSACVSALESLGSLGASAKSAIPRLRQLVEDEEIEVAQAAEAALAKIEK